eukprot:gnl/Spiro4/7972_TR4191_c0_g3_i2.p2 gnl/Spiro4/7972_TR4191_c0_g3~~gnl/Spiro4/7972_TR4191_c0_g3_i2.p2  ORF type:complete len:174 (+),score=54.41 gnl/Spiro4/7972_TR4191_c0_g3_i2:748-1269(+)
MQPYLSTFASLPPGLCVYFEVCAQHINARFQHLADFADIRVFDFTQNREYMSFSRVIELAREFALPLVRHELVTLNLETLLALLAAASNYTGVEAPNEGYVLRGAASAITTTATTAYTSTTSTSTTSITAPPSTATSGPSAAAANTHTLPAGTGHDTRIAKVRVADLAALLTS